MLSVSGVVVGFGVARGVVSVVVCGYAIIVGVPSLSRRVVVIRRLLRAVALLFGGFVMMLVYVLRRVRVVVGVVIVACVVRVVLVVPCVIAVRVLFCCSWCPCC